LITAPKGTDLKKAETILERYKIEKLPVVDKQGVLVGLITYKDILKLKSHPSSSKDQYGRLLCGAAVGVTPDINARIEALLGVSVDVVVIDTAHGHSKGVIDAVRKAKKDFKNIEIISGNIATAEAAKALIEAGADGVKVGIGRALFALRV
jgi:IMP dehydrogenase